MGLRIQNNIAAMNAHRQLTLSDGNLSKSLERLSSGYRINKAADDAAGLAISSGFRADIASFKVASRNTSEANSLLQVAEGGCEQIENMLVRLKELATQAASSNVGSSERTKINSEGNALISEIDRIAQSTKYGSSNLLDGTFGAAMAAGTYTGGADDNRVYGDMTHTYSVAELGGGVAGALAADLTITGLNASATCAVWTFNATGENTLTLGNGSTTETISIVYTSADAQTLAFANLGITLTANSNLTSSQFCGATVTINDTGVSSLNVTGAATGTYTFAAAGTGAITLGNGTVTQTISDLNPGTATTVNFSDLGITFNLSSVYAEDDLEAVSFTVSTSGTGATFQIGADNDVNNRISMSIGSLRAEGTTGLGLSYDSLDTATEAQSMLTTIDSAISTLSSRRGDIGAYMNRLSYAAANLSTTVENVQAAESVIRDVDMAGEMISFTKNQILLQAGTAMLAQANMAPQSILSLVG